jgi:hypothetical protein
MLHAVQAPLLKLIAVGAVGTAAIAGFGGSKCSKGEVTQHLVLHAPKKAHAIYMTAFNENNEATVTVKEAGAYRITFQTRATLPDSCRWIATEVLTPINDSQYEYSYDEEMLSCDEGAEPMYVATPRSGVVYVAD